MQSHKSLVLLACTRWLESIKDLPEEDERIDTKHIMQAGSNSLNISQDETDVSSYEDFDCDDKIKSKLYKD